MTPALTKQEAKEKCIKMWEHIRDNITDKEWRYSIPKGWGSGNHIYIKMRAISDLDLPDSDFSCYLCDLFNGDDDNCDGCPLSPEGKPVHCMHHGPYSSFMNNIADHQYARASAAANRLVEKVRAWEVGE